jgi:hypothetical protein
MAAWKRMVVITVHALPGGKKDAGWIANKIGETEGQYTKYGTIVDDKNYASDKGEVMMFLHYTMRNVDSAAVFLRSGPASASLIQLQQADTPLSDDDLNKIHQLVNPKAGIAPPAKKGK